MKTMEILKGGELAQVLEEGDLVAMDKCEVHIAFQGNKDNKGRICRPGIINGNEERCERLWKRWVNECNDFAKYKETVERLDRDHCEDCLGRLKKAGLI